MSLIQPLTIPINDREYRLVEAYNYRWTESGEEHLICIHPGFVSDSASVPRWLWSIMRPDGLVRGPALIHDLIYRKTGCFCKNPYGFHAIWSIAGNKPLINPFTWTRLQADKLFLKMCLEAKVPQAKLAYYGVRFGGLRAWLTGRDH